MSYKAILLKYLELLQEGDYSGITDLFDENAIVHSPVYGTMNAAKFYKTLSADTNNSQLTLLGIYENADDNSAILHFEYKWTLKSNQIIEFEVVDIFKFNDDKIVELTIIYDASVTKALLS